MVPAIQIKRIEGHPSLRDNAICGQVETVATASFIDGPLAEAAVNYSTAVAQLMEQSKDIDEIIMVLGNVFFVKGTDMNGKNICLVKTLSPTQLVALDRNPSILRSVWDALDFLGSMSASQQLGDDGTDPQALPPSNP